MLVIQIKRLIAILLTHPCFVHGENPLNMFSGIYEKVGVGLIVVGACGFGFALQKTGM